MAKDDPYFRLRIPEPLLAEIRVAAEANHRSATAEILARLGTSFAPLTKPDISRHGSQPLRIELDAGASPTEPVLAKILTEVQATRAAVEGVNRATLKDELAAKWHALGNDKEAKLAFARDLRSIMSVVEEIENAENDAGSQSATGHEEVAVDAEPRQPRRRKLWI